MLKGTDVNRVCAWRDLCQGTKAHGDPDPSSPCAHSRTSCTEYEWEDVQEPPSKATPASEEGKEGGEV